MYLETILLLEKSHGHAHGVEIARELGVSKASVTKAMKKLQTRGFIYKESYGTITLTERGMELSSSIYKKHELIKRYLMHSLNLEESEAEENACRMEHIVTDSFIKAAKTYLESQDILFR